MMHRHRGLTIRGKGAAVLFLVTALSGCGGRAGLSPPPEPAATPTPPPRAPVPDPSPPPQRGETYGQSVLLPSGSSAPLDPILDSPWARAEGIAEDVRYWVESFQTREAELFREGLARMGRYQSMVDQELSDRRLPSSLAFLPIVESWYNPQAVSRVGAGGLWQFMAPTARGMGMRVNRLVDERRDPFRSTPLALDFLGQLYDRFGSWFLALAAYNGGPGRVDRSLRRRAPGRDGHDGLFLEIRGDLPRETRNFVPRFLAAALIARDPAAYGFGDVLPHDTLAFDVVEVPDATSLDVVAQAAGVGQKEVEELNPQLLRGLTPAGVPTRLRLPVGSGVAFTDAYPRIPPEERVTFREHVVAAGETLSHIAVDYGVSVDDLRAANPRIEPRRMQVGQRVVVPTAPSAREASRTGVTGALGGLAEEELVVYRVRAGDTLSAIAARHRVRVGDLLRWNQLAMDAVIRPGDEVKIYRPGGR